MNRRPKRDWKDLEAAVVAALDDASDRPLTAYAIQDRAAAGGQRLYPTQIYRVMARLIAAGQVHRIESANAYMLRRSPSDAVALCDGCGRAFAYAMARPAEDIGRAIDASGFAVRSLLIEAVGLCRDCGP